VNTLTPRYNLRRRLKRTEYLTLAEVADAVAASQHYTALPAVGEHPIDDLIRGWSDGCRHASTEFTLAAIHHVVQHLAAKMDFSAARAA
jgi:hypothetical protein